MLYAIVAVLVLILDQSVKYWATLSIPLNEGSVSIIPGVISLVNTHNTGAAFGILQNARWLFVVIAVIFVAVVVFALWKNIIRDPLGRWSALLVMAGAIGNCIDRVMNGYVVDMFQFDFMNFAVFNVADMFISVCGVLFCVFIIFTDQFRDKEPEKRVSPKKSPRADAKNPPAATVRSAAPAASATEPKADGGRAAKPKAQAATPAAEKDPFSEWDVLPPLDARPNGTNVTVSATSVSSQTAEAKAPAKAKPAEHRTEFTLEDILSEYSSK